MDRLKLGTALALPPEHRLRGDQAEPRVGIDAALVLTLANLALLKPA
jgi:hypothetical protein